MARPLKVFRTSAGFHDAYVAATSRKAALEAWGADVDLFSRGVAEQVTDKALMAEPLKRPGEVIMKSRGGLADQLKALGPRKALKKDIPPRKSRPRKPPSRARLDKAEATLAETEKHQARELGALQEERNAIERKISVLETRHVKEISRLKRTLIAARESYRGALDRFGE